VWRVDGEQDGHGVRNNVIDSDVTYGKEPRFATTVVPATPLQLGQRYSVFIGMTGPTSTFGFDGSGAGFFTP
jgi:hypothetical protein